MNNNMLRVEEIRALWRASIDHMEQCAAALEDATAESDPDVVAELQRKFDAAEAEAERRRSEVDRLERIDAKRAEVYRTAPGESTSTSTSTEASFGATGKTSTASNAAVNIRIGHEPLTYEQRSSHSFVWDLANRDNNVNAAERLSRHSREMAIEMRDLGGASTSGGDFIAPVYLAEQWLDVARASRVLSNLGRNFGPPPRNSSFTIPRLVSDPSVAVQASNNAAISETDVVTALLTVNRATIAGQQDIPQQLLDDSSPGLDQIVFNALGMQYGLSVNQQMFSGSGAAGQTKGLLTASGTIAITYTDATPTGPELYTSINQAISQVTTQRFQAPTAIVMHPRRWFWLAQSVDLQGRPLVVPVGANAGNLSQEAENAFGVYSVQAYGLVGFLAGLPVYIDPSVPTNLGAGTNEDRIFVLRAEDIMRWEDPVPRAETFREVLSSTLTVRLRVYGYFAATFEAYAKGMAIISGTGLIAPAGF